jgi:hypothetical protein
MAITRLILLLLIVLAATGWQPAPASAAPSTAPAAQSSPCATAAAAAIAQRGKPYVWGAKGPNAFDCSGLTQWAWGQAGYNIGLSTYDQATRGTAIPCRLSDIAGASTTCWEPGDLIFLRYAGGQHVAMYLDDGLFADAYHPDTGVIIHNPALDSFYQDHFWQARRIVSCEGTVISVPSPDASPASVPGLEEIPDILAEATFTVPQCGDCDELGVALLPPQPWSESWPAGFELLDLGRVFRVTISWLSWQVSEMIRQLICWLLNMLATLAAIISTGLNALIYGINSMFKMLVLLWLTFKAWFLAFWGLLESMRDLLLLVSIGLGGLAEFGRLIFEVALLIGLLIGRLLLLMGQLALALIGIVGWLGGLVLGFWSSLQLALAGTVVPSQLAETHVIYRATRGMLEGVRDSQIGWAFYLLWAMAYVAFVTWLARFLSVGAAGRGESS